MKSRELLKIGDKVYVKRFNPGYFSPSTKLLNEPVSSSRYWINFGCKMEEWTVNGPLSNKLKIRDYMNYGIDIYGYEIESEEDNLNTWIWPLDYVILKYPFSRSNSIEEFKTHLTDTLGKITDQLWKKI